MLGQARRSAAWSTADAIKAHIIDAGLAPGDLMPTENELCDTLGVSRSSVREAMRTLASLDIVEVRHGHGTYVGRMSLDPLVNGMVFRLSATGIKSLRDVVQTRIALDLAMADDLVASHDGSHDETLHLLVEQMREHTRDGRTFIDQDRDFHARLTAGIDNQIIAELVGAFWEIHTRALPLLGVSSPQDIMDTVEAHAAILRAVEDGDVRAYQAAVQAHYAPLQRAIERVEVGARPSRRGADPAAPLGPSAFGGTGSGGAPVHP